MTAADGRQWRCEATPLLLRTGAGRGRVLAVGGSDSGGGAGIQADIKTITMLGGYAATSITAVTAQNTRGIWSVDAMLPELVRAQMELVLKDIGADCVKTGMLDNDDTVRAVAAVLSEPYALHTPLVVDPCLSAKGGAALLEEEALAALRFSLLPRADLVTPNIPEAERIAEVQIYDEESTRRAAIAIAALGPRAVLVKGGHALGEDGQAPATSADLLYTPADGRFRVFRAPRLETRHSHGTGCTLASAIATGLARGMELVPAIAAARNFLHGALAEAPGFGTGSGPMAHNWCLRRAVPDACTIEELP
eukprot:tig00001366_g8384.t1